MKHKEPIFKRPENKFMNILFHSIFEEQLRDRITSLFPQNTLLNTFNFAITQFTLF